LVRLLLSQSSNPAAQGPVQFPAVHSGVTLLLEHADPHPPQLLAFV
jgi:hypothetical protein